MNSRGATTIVTSSGARAPRKRRRKTRKSRRVQGIRASRGRPLSSTHDRSMAPIERFLCASMKSPTSSFAVALYDTRTRTRAQRASNRAQPRLRRSSAPRASLARIARHRRRSFRQRPRNRARQCAAAFTRRESRRTASDDTAPICPSPPTRSARWTTTRRPPRRRRKSRRATPSQRRKVRATRRVSVLDGATRSQGKRMRGDEEMI